MRSQPATIGSRVTAVNATLACPTRIASVIRMATVTIGVALPNGPYPTRSTCATGPTKSMLAFGTYATTVLVPSTNINAMTGAAMNTDRATDRDGAFVSPARIAMYSKPPSAPNPIFPRMFRLYSDSSGTCVRNGWYSESVPVTRPITGSSTIALKTVIMKMPPVLCTHLPTDSPIVDVTTISDRMTADDKATNQVLLVIHCARGPIAYDK